MSLKIVLIFILTKSWVSGFALAAIEDRGVEASMTKFGWIYLIIGIIETFVYISTFAIVEIEPVKSAVAAFPWLFTRVFR